MSKHLGTIKTLSYQACVLTTDDNIKLMEKLLQSIQSHPDAINHPKKYVGTLFLKLESIVYNDDTVQQQIQNQINKLTNNQSIKPQNQGLISLLPIHVLAEIAPFLTRQENIRMRHVSKLFNVEFSNKDLVVKSHWNEEKGFEINQHIFNHIIYGQPNSLKYEFPNAIIINVGVLHECYYNWFKNKQNIQCWNSLFTYVNQIRITQYNIHMLQYIPIDIVFNVAHGKQIAPAINIDLNCRHYLLGPYYLSNDTLSTVISKNPFTRRACRANINTATQSLQNFQQKYLSYFSDQCNNDQQQIRQIETLKISNADTKEILLLSKTLTNNFTQLLLNHCNLCIGTLQELNEIFHPNLQTLHLQNENSIICGSQDLISNIQNNEFKIQYGNIQSLCICVTPYHLVSLRKTLTNLTLLRIWSKVESLRIEITRLWSPLKKSRPISMVCGEGFLYHLLHNKCKDIDFPQLKNIRILAAISDTHTLDNIIAQINELGKIVNDINDSIDSIQFILDVIENINIVKDLGGTNEMSTNNAFQYLNEQGIRQICDWLQIQQWIGIPKKHKIQITFKCERNQINNNDTQTETTTMTDDFYIASLEYYTLCAYKSDFKPLITICEDTQQYYKTMSNDTERIHAAKMQFINTFQTLTLLKPSFVKFYTKTWKTKSIDYLIDNLPKIIQENSLQNINILKLVLLQLEWHESFQKKQKKKKKPKISFQTMQMTFEEIQKTYTTTDLIRFQAGIQQASKQQLAQWFQSLDQSQCQWVITNFVDQFLPCHTNKNDNISKNIDRIHNERRKHIETNDKDYIILHQLKQQIIEPYMNTNKQSKNTNKKRNTYQFDSLPKNLLANIMSYVNCKDRNTSVCLLSRIFYYASQEMIGKHELNLNHTILQQIKNGTIDPTIINQYENICIKTKVWKCTLAHYMPETQIVALFAKLKCITLDYDDQWLHYCQKPQCLLAIAKHDHICDQIQKITLTRIQIYELLPFFKKCNQLKSLTINKHTDKVDHYINIPIYKWFISDINLQNRLTSLRLDLSRYSKWSKEWHIMHSIHKFVNLRELELHLCLPQNFAENKPNTMTTNKLSYLEALTVQWYYCVAARPHMSQIALSSKRIESNWEHIANNHSQFYRIVPEIESWENIMMIYHKYLLSMANNIHEYTMKCPQWTNPLPSMISYQQDCEFMDRLLSVMKTVKKFNVTMADATFDRLKFGIKDCPTLKWAQITLIFTEHNKILTQKPSLMYIFDDIVMLCTSKYLETLS